MNAAKEFLAESCARIEAHLDAVLPKAQTPPRPLHEAMRYAALSGGKRLRPALAFGSALALEEAPEAVLNVAAAAELVHAYSLVHDDLPAMDDDRERRGQPTVHVRYGEATAILVGDALLAEAFGQLARGPCPPELLARLAETASSRLLVGGQADDLASSQEPGNLEAILSIHARKTAALFRFSVWGAGRALAAESSELADLDAFGLHYGMAFQLVDDLRDADPTECSALRMTSAEEIQILAKEDIARALSALETFGSAADPLRGLAEALAKRLT